MLVSCLTVTASRLELVWTLLVCDETARPDALDLAVRDVRAAFRKGPVLAFSLVLDVRVVPDFELTTEVDLERVGPDTLVCFIGISVST